MSNFDRIAPVYDRLAGFVFGRAIRDAQRAHLTALSEAQNILFIGGGTGGSLKDLLQVHPTAKVFYIEASQRMLRLAANRLSDDERLRVTFLHGTEHDLPRHIRTDAVVVQFLVDMYSEKELMPLLQRLYDVLPRHGLVFCADFVDDAWWQRAMLTVMYFFFRITTGLTNRTLSPWRKMFVQAGFQCEETNAFWHEFIFSALYRKNEG